MKKNNAAGKLDDLLNFFNTYFPNPLNTTSQTEAELELEEEFESEMEFMDIDNNCFECIDRPTDMSVINTSKSGEFIIQRVVAK